jgi:hypothetical protein
MRFESGKGKGRSKTALIRLKIATFAPIPSAKVATETVVNKGFCRSIRAPIRRSRSTVSRLPRFHILKGRSESVYCVLFGVQEDCAELIDERVDLGIARESAVDHD